MNKPLQVKRVTLGDIASAAGCSKNTVSLALRRSTRISTALRLKICAIAEQFNYTTDYAARNLRAGHSGLLGIYTRPLQDAVRTEMVNHLLSELHTTKYRPVLGLGEPDCRRWSDSPWMQTFRELRIEALVLLWNFVPDGLHEWIRNTPVIMVGNEPAPDLECDCLALDRRQAGTLGVEHLLARGRRRILIGACNSDFRTGCLKAIEAAGYKPYTPPYEPNYLNIRDARLFGHTLSTVNEPPDGALFGDSGFAAMFIRSVVENKFNVPRDIAVVAYDYFPSAELLAVPLTTIEQPIETMAKKAVELIRRRLSHPEAPLLHMVQPHRLFVRESS